MDIQSLQWYIFTPVKGLYKIPRLLHIIPHVTKTRFTLGYCPLHRTKKTNSATDAQKNTEQYNIIFIQWYNKNAKCFIHYFKFQTKENTTKYKCVPNNTTIVWCGLSASFMYFIAMSTFSNSVAKSIATSIYHSQEAQQSWPTSSSSHLYLESLLRPT